MEAFSTIGSIGQYVAQQRLAGKTVGFVPTMGALHSGHLALIAQAKTQADVVVCSIFVNPTQFNDPADLEKYPRPIEQDIAKLTQAGCHALFNPSVAEMYSPGETWDINLGQLEQVFEGKYRPGHFKGVTQVVSKLFNMVKPDVAFFGQKDYQQFLVITRMQQLLQLPVRLVMCPIVRDNDGLALSSRNIHLSAAQKQHALVLSQTLNFVKQQFKVQDIAVLEQQAADRINHTPEMKLDYFSIADANTLLPPTADTTAYVALVAAYCGHTRLIDNMILAQY